MSIRVAVDIGGGFADLAAIDLASGEMFWSKTYTTPEDLRICVKEVFRLSKLQPQSVSQLLHGQTLVINSILQRAGAKVGLITTKGFRDVLQTPLGLDGRRSSLPALRLARLLQSYSRPSLQMR